MVQERISLAEVGNVLSCKETGQAALPKLVSALDLAFGLRSGSEAQRDVVKAKGGSKLRMGFGGMGEEKAVVVYVEAQWQAAALED